MFLKEQKQIKENYFYNNNSANCHWSVIPLAALARSSLLTEWFRPGGSPATLQERLADSKQKQQRALKIQQKRWSWQICTFMEGSKSRL